MPANSLAVRLALPSQREDSSFRHVVLAAYTRGRAAMPGDIMRVAC